MTNAPALAVAYLQKLPESSARVIARMHPEDAASLLETLPVRIIARVFEKMEKWPAAQCLQHFNAEQAAAILDQIPYQDATILLRLTPADRRNVIFGQLPSRLARDFQASLRYPRNTVGAWMDLSVPNLSLNATIKDAIGIVRAAPQPLGDPIFVVDEGHRLMGFVRAETLLRHSTGTRLGEIMQTGLKPLFARMPLREADSEPAWNDFLVLPVASRRGQLVGTLSNADMKRGLTGSGSAYASADAENSIPAQVGGAFIASMAGLIDLLGADNSSTRSER